MKDRLAGIFIWLYFLAGTVGIVRLIMVLVPGESSEWSYILRDVLCVVVPCIFGAIYYEYAEKPVHATRNQLNQAKQRITELEEAIQHAILRETTVDLYDYCDPDWSRHIQEIKREARDQRAYKEYVESLAQIEPPNPPD